MSDREMLDAAAKVSGCAVWGRFGAGEKWLRNDGHGLVPWNPLTDDGDALRLAVKLRIDVTHFGSSVRTIARNADGVVVDVCEIGQVTGAEGVRRVIVMAAAAIGAAS